MINDDFITIELEFIENAELSLQNEIQQAYGMSYKEYVIFRNALLKQYDYCLPMEKLSEELIKKATIDLVATGYLSPDLTDVNSELIFTITTKGYKAIVNGLEKGYIEPEMKNWEALYSLRNNKLLK